MAMTFPGGILMKKTTEVFCTSQIEGTHCWPDCPFDEVAYLRVPHRHVFHIKAYKIVTHSDRDVEFIMLKHQVRNYLIKKYGRMSVAEKQTLAANPTSEEIHYYHCEFGAMSCEMLAEELITEFDLSRCEVNEDGENGAIVTSERVA